MLKSNVLLYGLSFTLLAANAIFDVGLAQHLYELGKSEPGKPAVFASPVDDQAMTIKLDPGWHPVAANKHGNEYKMQFYPPRTGAEPVTETITMSTLILPASVDSIQYTADLKKFIEAGKQSATLIWKSIRQNPKEVFFEYTLQDHQSFPDQSEIWRVIKTNFGIGTLCYHVNRRTINKDERDKAMRMLASGGLIPVSSRR